MSKKSNVLTDQLIRIVDRFLQMDKNNIIAVENGIKLYPSEIHLILILATGQADNFNGLVRNLGITKGAVSQTITRLEKKGILEKRREGNNDMAIVFTSLGLKVGQYCKNILSALYERFSSYFLSLPGDEKEIIGRFLTHIEENMDVIGKIGHSL